MAEQWKKKCVDCGEEVAYGKFGPCKGHPGNHTLEMKTYYHPGARDIQDPRDRRKFAPVLILQPGYDQRDPQNPGQLINVKGCDVQFYDGKVETVDPQIQYHLDHKVGILSGEEGLRLWRSIYLTEDQQNNIARAELAETQRQIKEANDLLAQVKAKQGGKQSA
jgi:hypothetical protein